MKLLTRLRGGTPQPGNCSLVVTIIQPSDVVIDRQDIKRNKEEWNEHPEVLNYGGVIVSRTQNLKTEIWVSVQSQPNFQATQNRSTREGKQLKLYNQQITKKKKGKLKTTKNQPWYKTRELLLVTVTIRLKNNNGHMLFSYPIHRQNIIYITATDTM